MNKSPMSWAEAKALMAATIERLEFDQVFVMKADESVDPKGLGDVVLSTNRYDVHAPEVINDPEGDVEIMGAGWKAMTGLSNQHGYSGAVMHPSEYVGPGVVEAMWDIVTREVEGPTYFALVTVQDDGVPDEDGYGADPIGWAIVYRPVTLPTPTDQETAP